jgi:hypothetical protein
MSIPMPPKEPAGRLNDYFIQDDPFADFVVHEVGHTFHNCKRATFGLLSFS